MLKKAGRTWGNRTCEYSLQIFEGNFCLSSVNQSRGLFKYFAPKLETVEMPKNISMIQIEKSSSVIVVCKYL